MHGRYAVKELLVIRIHAKFNPCPSGTSYIIRSLINRYRKGYFHSR